MSTDSVTPNRSVPVIFEITHRLSCDSIIAYKHTHGTYKLQATLHLTQLWDFLCDPFFLFSFLFCFLFFFCFLFLCSFFLCSFFGFFVLVPPTPPPIFFFSHLYHETLSWTYDTTAVNSSSYCSANHRYLCIYHSLFCFCDLAFLPGGAVLTPVRGQSESDGP